MKVNDEGSELFNQHILKLDDEYNELTNAERNELHSRYNISDLFLSVYNYDDYFVPPLEEDEKGPPMPPLEGVIKKSQKKEKD